MLEVRGAARQALRIKSRGQSSAVRLYPAVQSGGTTTDVGDFEVAFTFAPIGRAEGFAAGGHVGLKLPNSDERKGIGSNTTDVTLAGLFSWASPRWRTTGWFGVSILESPADLFEQNDVFAFAVESLWQVSRSWSIAAGTRGRISTRRISPAGAGDLGELRATAVWSRGSISVDAALGYGYTEMSGDWSLRGGVAWLLSGGR